MKLNQNELLDLVFREDKKRFYDEEFKSNTGMRRKYKKIFSDEKYVSYDTYYGGGLGTARERQRFNGDRYIEFQDRDGIVTGTAELTDNNHVCGIEAQAKEACKNNWQSIRNDTWQQGAFQHAFVQPFHTNTNLGI